MANANKYPTKKDHLKKTKTTGIKSGYMTYIRIYIYTL